MRSSTRVERREEEATQSVSDVRANIARLEARARSMLTDTDNSLMVRSGRGVLQLSKATLADLSKNAPANATSNASAELFMANLGFDVQEQQRLLQQMILNQSANLAVYSNGVSDDEMGGVGGGPSHDGIVDLDAFLATRRSEALQRCVDEVHRHISDRTHELAEAHIRSFWERRSADIAGALEGGHFASALRPQYQTLASKSMDGHGSDAQGRMSNATAVGPSTKALTSSKMNGFAHIVDVTSPQEWASHFSDFVQNTNVGSTTESDCCALWSSVERLLSPLIQSSTAGASSPTASMDGVKKYIASSRMVLERKFLTAMFFDVLKCPPSKIEEMEAMHEAKLVDIVVQYSNQSNDYWHHVFLAMRCGRYDAAQAIASQHGNKLLQNALNVVATTPALARNDIKSFHDLRSQYLEEATRASTSPFRTVVLFLLLVGATNQDAETAMNIFLQAVDRATTTIDDTLWMRLVCIRHVDNSVNPVQCLANLQKSVLADVSSLLEISKNNAFKVAAVLFHTVLPSTALRILQDGPDGFCDAVHMAIVFHVFHLLRCTASESQINLSSLLQTYALRVLDADDRKASRRAAPSLFQYFLKTDSMDAFVDLCRSPIVCAKLFGNLGDTTANEGALLHGSATTSPEILRALDAVADLNASIGQPDLAVHVLLVLDRLASLQRDVSASRDALQKALQIVNPALSFSAHHQGSSESLIIYARRLRDRLQQSTQDLSSRDVQTFQQLFIIADFHSHLYRNEMDLAVSKLLSLPFIPTQISEVDDAAQQFNTSVSDDVATAMPPTILAFLRVELARLQKMTRSDREKIVQMVKSIVRWVSRWRFSSGYDFLRDLQALETQFSA